MPPEGETDVSGVPSAAILMMLLEDSEAAEVLRHLDPEEVRQLGSEMYAAAEADEAAVGNALNRFVDGSREVSALAPGADRKIRSVMAEALGNVRADNLLAKIAPQQSGKTLELLRWMEREVIAAVVAGEHPQVGAVIISVLTPEAAAGALADLDGAQQADLLYRAARLQTVRAEAIADLEAILSAAESRRDSSPQVELGGEGNVARIVNSLSRPAGENILKLMRKKDKVLAAAIEDEMFVFEDLNKLDAKSLGAVLRGVEAATLALALKGAETALSDRFLATMSARAADTIRDELAEMAPVKREEVDAARKAIIAVARAMAASGEIMLGGKSDEYV
jgi:flagellar motor switch protein FliG